MEPSNLESQPNIKETFPEYFPILEVDNKSRLILKHYKPRLRSFSAPATSHVQQDDREDVRKDDQEDFIILHDPKLTPETLQRSISLTRNGDQFYTLVTKVFHYESDNNANKPKEASVFISQLDKFVTERQLQIPFEECGNVLYCKIEKNQIHNNSLGLARLTFYEENDGDALNAARDSIFKFNGKQLFNGPPIKLELDNDGSKLKAAADAIIAENQRSLEPFINNKMREPSPLPNDDDMEIGDAPSPPAVIGSVPLAKTSSASQYSESDKTKKKSVLSISHSRDSDNRSHASPEKHDQKVESAPKKPIDDDKEEGEIDSNYEDESLFGPISGHSSSRDKGKWFESNDRNRNQERRRRNSSRERFIRNNLTIERSRSRSRGRSPIGNSNQQRSRDRDYGRSRNYDSVRNRDRDSVQIYNRDSSRSHDRDISRIHDRSTIRDNDRFVFRNNDREVIRSGRDIFKEAYSDDKKSEVSDTRDYWTTEKFDGTKNSSVEIPSRDHAKYRKKSQLNKDSLSKSHPVNEPKNRIQNDIPMKFDNKDNETIGQINSLSIKRQESSHVSRYEIGLSEDKSNSNLKKPLQRINSSRVESIGYRKPNISDWDYSSSDSSNETDKDRKRMKAQDAKRKPLPKNIVSASTKVEDNKKVDSDEKKRNQALQQKKLSQKQISKPNTQNVTESTTKSKILRKSKNVDATISNINKEADISLLESIKTVRKQKIMPVSNIKTNLEAGGSSDVTKQRQNRKLKEGVTTNVKSQQSNDNIRRIINRSSNDVIISSETSDSDGQSPYKPHLYDESANDDDEYIDRDYLTSGDEITDAYDLDMIRLYLELNEKGLIGSDGEPIEWSENEVEFTIRVGDHVESFKDYAPDDGPHKTGCARTEGYYKIPPEEKRKYVAYGIPGTSYATDKAPAPSSRASRAKRRELQSRMAEYQDVATDADILLYNPLKAREKELTIAKSKIHHYGLFALERIKANEFVIQYTGELIRQAVADLRERKYKAEGIDGSYMFRVGDDTIIDATKMGNNARLINHSCDPNCNAKILTIKGKKKIAIYAKRDIEFGEEITYDYKFPIDKHDKIPCHCVLTSNARLYIY
ncbi:histone-lysine N-methyltransferase SETD1-like [Rhizophagus irregularis DAOM 181602=DAOM 197198]|nr:histone-lysine N-methyltransferase SETD1-like [Rhizophagus irregularis DAOM 181602=DAOM 197198]